MVVERGKVGQKKKGRGCKRVKDVSTFYSINAPAVKRTATAQNDMGYWAACKLCKLLHGAWFKDLRG